MTAQDPSAVTFGLDTFGDVTEGRDGRAKHPAEVIRDVVEQGVLADQVGVGGSPPSVLRAARHRLPLMLAIIGGDPVRFRPLVDLYRQSLDEAGLPLLPVGVHSPGHIAPTDEQARAELFPHFKANRDRIGAERGWPPMGQHEFDREAGPHGSLYVGSPETVAHKIARTVRSLGLERFDLKYSNGPMPHEQSMRAIELYGTEVIPRVRELLAERADALAS